MTFLRGNDDLVGKFKKCGHLRTFPDIQAWRPGLEEASMSGFGADRLFIEVFSVINCHVAPVALLNLSMSHGMLSRINSMVEMCFTNWQATSVMDSRAVKGQSPRALT